MSTDTVESKEPAVVSDKLSRRLNDRSVWWVDGGELSRWSPVHSRSARPVVTAGQQMRFTFNRSAATAIDPVVQRWLDHQATFVEAGDGADGQMVFWRLAVRHRALAIDVSPAKDLDASAARAKRIIRRATGLRVVFGFTDGEPIPNWVVHDREVPVLLGLPNHHLVRTPDPTRSLAGYVAAAQLRAHLHDIGSETVPVPRSGWPG